MLMILCIMLMEVSGGKLTKYISGKTKQNETKKKKKKKKKKPFQQVAWWMDNLIYFS